MRSFLYVGSYRINRVVNFGMFGNCLGFNFMVCLFVCGPCIHRVLCESCDSRVRVL